jgi:adenylate kinase family enzyme
MNKVAIFGNAGAGKSTLARRLAELTVAPLYPLDLIQFRAGRYWPNQEGGGKIPHEEYLRSALTRSKRVCVCVCVCVWLWNSKVPASRIAPISDQRNTAASPCRWKTYDTPRFLTLPTTLFRSDWK